MADADNGAMVRGAGLPLSLRLLSGKIDPDPTNFAQDVIADEEDLLMQSEDAAVIEEDTLEDIATGTAELPPPRMTKKDRDRALSKELRELRERRMKKLEEMRVAAEERAKATEHLSNDARLRYIMQQAEVFSHFLHGRSDVEAAGSGGTASSSAAAAGVAGGSAASGKRGGKHATSARDEEEELMAEVQGSVGASVKLTKQPDIVTGTMRDYQLEGTCCRVSKAVSASTLPAPPPPPPTLPPSSLSCRPQLDDSLARLKHLGHSC
jgi:hypothetical protein